MENDCGEMNQKGRKRSRYSKLGQRNRKVLKFQGSTIYKQIDYKPGFMGADCTRSSPKQESMAIQTRLQSQQSDPVRCREALHLEIRLQNLQLINLVDVVERITFAIDDIFEVSFPKSQFHVHEKTIKWNKSHSGIFQILGEDLDRKKMRIKIFDNKNKIVEKLSFKLLQLCTGPAHQDHLLHQMKARLAFDIRITQRMSFKLFIKGFQLDLFQQDSIHHFGYSISLRTGHDDQIYETETVFFKQTDKFPERTLNLQILSHNLKQSTIRIQIWKRQQNPNGQYKNVIDHYSDIYIPYQKIMTDLFTSTTENGKQIERRKVEFEELIGVTGVNKARCSFSIHTVASKLYVQQMECLIFSQYGIGTISPHQISCEKEAAVQISQLKIELEKLQKLENYTSKEKPTIKKALVSIFDMTKKGCKVSYTSNQELYSFQLVLIQILEKAARMLRAGEDIVNENLWRVINTIIHRVQLSIRYISIHYDESRRKDVGCRYFCFICLLLEKIIHSTTIGVTYHELQCIQKFAGYVFFRFPWLQKNIIKTLLRPGDPHINSDRLIQLGACLAVKSPSKNAVYDWEASVFNNIKGMDPFKKAMVKLEELSFQIPDWSKILFNRSDDDLFYGLYKQIWNQAQISLSYQGHIKWQYFPYYGQLLSAFLGEMNKNPILEYSSQFKECSLKLITNQRLLNSFMMLLFAKTCLYQSYCVMKCLDLIKGYFQVITLKKRKLPADFNCGYFYTGLKTILNSSHSYLLVKALSLIYDYYHLFSREFKLTINTFILGKPFYNLFLHWCGFVRNIFFYLLQFRILNFIQANPEDVSLKVSMNGSYRQMHHKYDNLIQSLEELESELKEKESKEAHLKKSEYYVRMREKLKMKKLVSKPHGVKFQRSSSWNQDKIEDARRKISDNDDFYRVRKWSMSDDELNANDIPKQLKKYVINSMREFRSISSEPNPNDKVDRIEKMFGDEGVEIDP